MTGPEERLRKLLAEAVEPVEPAPGAQARLQAKVRRRETPRDVRRGLRWAGATLGTAAVVAGAAVAISAQHGDDTKSSASSASTADSSAGMSSSPMAGPSAAASPSALSPNLGAAVPRSPRAASPAPQLDQLYAPTAGSVAGGTSQKAAAAPAPLGGGLTISGQQLVAKFPAGTQSVSLPKVSEGARVLGVTQLKTAAGAQTSVAFVRLQASSGEARDTLVAVVGGRLTVLRLSGTPVELAVTDVQGYTCAGPLVVRASGVVNYVVSGADLIADGSSGLTSKAGSNCGFS